MSGTQTPGTQLHLTHRAAYLRGVQYGQATRGQTATTGRATAPPALQTSRRLTRSATWTAGLAGTAHERL